AGVPPARGVLLSAQPRVHGRAAGKPPPPDDPGPDRRGAPDGRRGRGRGRAKQGRDTLPRRMTPALIVADPPMAAAVADGVARSQAAIPCIALGPTSPGWSAWREL